MKPQDGLIIGKDQSLNITQRAEANQAATVETLANPTYDLSAVIAGLDAEFIATIALTLRCHARESGHPVTTVSAVITGSPLSRGRQQNVLLRKPTARYSRSTNVTCTVFVTSIFFRFTFRAPTPAELVA
jgi:hypothetical protein